MNVNKGTPDDPKGLILEAYRIDGITLSQCRSIFLDWALSLDGDRPAGEAIAALLVLYGQDEAHPMTAVLREGQHQLPTPRRRGGWRGRKRD